MTERRSAGRLLPTGAFSFEPDSGRRGDLGQVALLPRRQVLVHQPLAVGALAFFSAVRSAERCARLRTVAARDFRMFFFADAIFGTKQTLQKIR